MLHMRKLLYLLKERNGNLRLREFCIFSRQAPDTDWQRSRILLTTRPLTVMWPKYTANTNKKYKIQVPLTQSPSDIWREKWQRNTIFHLEEKMNYVERRKFGGKGWTRNFKGNGGTYWIWKTFGVRRRERMKKKIALDTSDPGWLGKGGN